MAWTREFFSPAPDPEPCGNRRSERVKELDTIMVFACQRLPGHQGDHAAVSVGGFITWPQFEG
jgi:hypothetical protein